MRQAVNRLLSVTGYALTRARHDPRFELYGLNERPKLPRFLNIGAGSWSHPLWHNLENPRPDYQKSRYADIAFDLTSEEPWPIDSGTLDIVYSSHTIEHLNDKFVYDLCREARRCLKPGGVIRLTTPNMDLYTEAYSRRDRFFFNDASGSKDHSIEQSFLYCFAGPLSDFHKGIDVPKVSDEEIRRAFSSSSHAEFFERFCSRLSDDVVRIYPKHHKTWFTPEKLCAMLTASGLKARQSAYGQSAIPALRDTNFFDRTHPGLSLYVEASLLP